jgi:hypothetical protein
VHHATEQAARDYLFFGLQPGKLGVGPLGQRSGCASDLVVSLVREPISLAVLP